MTAGSPVSGRTAAGSGAAAAEQSHRPWAGSDDCGPQPPNPLSARETPVATTFEAWMRQLREIAEYEGAPELIGDDEYHWPAFSAGSTPVDTWRGLADKLDEPTPRQIQRNA